MANIAVLLQVIVTKRIFGAKKPSYANLDTKSAKHAKVQLKLIKPNGDSSEKDPDDNKEKNSSDSKNSKEQTTKSYIVQVGPKTAVKFFNELDQVRSTPAFLKKAEAYKEAKKRAQEEFPPQQLDGAGKVKYYNAVKGAKFPYYTVKATMFVDDGNELISSTKSMVHNRLDDYTLKDLLARLERYSNLDAIKEMTPAISNLSLDQIRSKYKENKKEAPNPVVPSGDSAT